MAEITITTPSSDDASDMGIREWPQTLKRGEWEEFSEEGQLLVRYILDGTGTLDVEDSEAAKRSIKVKPGTLVEVSGEAILSWKAEGEVIVLTPGFEEGGTFLGVAVAVIILFGTLLAGVGS